MGYGKKKRVFKKKGGKRRYKKRGVLLRIPRPAITSSGLPPNYPIKMKYCDTLNFTLPAYPLNIVQQYNLNDIYDPYRTGVGHQPYFHDQMSPFYTNYKVLGCKVVATTTGLSQHINICFRADDVTTPVSNFTLEQERPGATHCLVSQPPVKNVFFKKYFSIPKVLKTNAKEYREDDDFKVAMNNSPTGNPAVLNILYENADHLGGTDTILLNIILEYDVILMDLKVQSQST